MSRFDDVITMLNSFSFPCDFDHAKIGNKVPFSTYTFSASGVSADNTIYVKTYEFTFRVYVSKLSKLLDKEIEDKFAENEIVWTRSEPTYIEDSKVYEIDYEFGIVG